MVKLLVQKQTHVLDLLRVRDFSWPFSVNIVYEGDFDAMLEPHGIRLNLGEGHLSDLMSWKKRLNFWKYDKTPNTNLLKALGAKANDLVVDATLGFGDDSSFLLSRGVKVHCFERLPALYFAHKASSLLDEMDSTHLQINYGQAKDHISDVKSIFFDPMYDDGKSRKAASRKEMSFLHKKVGGDEDAISQGEILRNKCQRLVVKRPPKAPDLLANKNSSWKTKAVRFDLYL